MSQNSVDWILNQSHSFPLLTAEQEIVLNRHVMTWLEVRDLPNPNRTQRAQIRRGKRAYDAFFLSNIRLVVHVAKRYTQFAGSLGLDDLIQEGLIGLERAIVKFDSTRGYKFSTYAFNWIRQSINRAISYKSRTIRLPCHAIDVLKKAYDFINEQYRVSGTRPPMAQVAKHCGIELATLKAYLPYNGAMISLDDKCTVNGADEASSLLEMIADTSAYSINELDEYDDLVESLRDIMAGLSDEETLIIHRRWFDDGKITANSFGALARELGVSRQAVTQRHDRALRRLRMQLITRTRPADTPALQCAA